mmetsp:Transcript_26277/g.75819  ORF Transcript_26277/g.75819 Transcript_26277/m.75819 type:complete len:241 (-) Transcript_26277:88-810(-)
MEKPLRRTQSDAACLPKAHGSLTTDVAARLYFSTSATSTFKDHFAVDTSAPKSTSMKEILFPGAVYRERTAPGPTRTMCEYGAEFFQQPSDMAAIDKELRGAMAEKSINGCIGVQRASLGWATTSREDFRKHRKNQPGVSCKPQGLHIKEGARFLETRSSAHNDFRSHGEAARTLIHGAGDKPRNGPPVDNLQFGGSFMGRSSYSRDFTAGRDDACRDRRRRKRPATTTDCRRSIWRDEV